MMLRSSSLRLLSRSIIQQHPAGHIFHLLSNSSHPPSAPICVTSVRLSRTHNFNASTRPRPAFVLDEVPHLAYPGGYKRTIVLGSSRDLLPKHQEGAKPIQDQQADRGSEEASKDIEPDVLPANVGLSVGISEEGFGSGKPVKRDGDPYDDLGVGLVGEYKEKNNREGGKFFTQVVDIPAKANVQPIVFNDFKPSLLLTSHDVDALLLAVAEMDDLQGVMDCYFRHEEMYKSAELALNIMVRRELITGGFRYAGFQTTSDLLADLYGSLRSRFHAFLGQQPELKHYVDSEPNTPRPLEDGFDISLLRLDARVFLKIIEPQAPEDGLNALNQFVHGVSIAQAFKCAEFYHREFLRKAKPPPGTISDFTKFVFHVMLYTNVETVEKSRAARALMDSTIEGRLGLQLNTLGSEFEMLYPGKLEDGSPRYLSKGSLKRFLEEARATRATETSEQVKKFRKRVSDFAEGERGRRLRKFGQQLHQADGLSEFKEEIKSEFLHIHDTIRANETEQIVEEVLRRLQEEKGVNTSMEKKAAAAAVNERDNMTASKQSKGGRTKGQ